MNHRSATPTSGGGFVANSGLLFSLKSKNSNLENNDDNDFDHNNHSATTTTSTNTPWMRNPQDDFDEMETTIAATLPTLGLEVLNIAQSGNNNLNNDYDDDDDDSSGDALLLSNRKSPPLNSSHHKVSPQTVPRPSPPLLAKPPSASASVCGATATPSTTLGKSLGISDVTQPIMPEYSSVPPPQPPTTTSTSATTSFRARNTLSRRTTASSTSQPSPRRRRRRRHRSRSRDYGFAGIKEEEDNPPPILSYCCRDRTVVRSTLSVMNFLAKVVVWSSVIALAAAVIWYSYELKNNGADPHLIAWFSAGAFVLLGFPISMYGIVAHLANYNQPNVQCYIVRILWMVPIYSMESWLCLRFHKYAMYIETLRDCYESYVLYSFLQFLIQVLGGEDALILMLKDKSPTRGVHMWGLQWCVKPWLMGQPMRITYEDLDDPITPVASNKSFPAIPLRQQRVKKIPLKRVHWKSPFFIQCKFGVLQYVLLKFVCSIATMVLEWKGVYKEGNFSYKGGYLYICILTNLSQCWALYCLIFFYYATKNELSAIRPVGKFLSVKALVFFTWWQSVCISILYQMEFIPHYYHWGVPHLQQQATENNSWSYGGAIWSNSTAPDPYHSDDGVVMEWTAEDVAKGLQDYLICIEMFLAAIVHAFVFPHTEYTPQAVEARARALNQTPHKHWNKRLGRKWKELDNKSALSATTSSTNDGQQSNNPIQQRLSWDGGNSGHNSSGNAPQESNQLLPLTYAPEREEVDLLLHPYDRYAPYPSDSVGLEAEDEESMREMRRLLEPVQSEGSDEDHGEYDNGGDDDDDDDDEEDGEYYDDDSSSPYSVGTDDEGRPLKQQQQHPHHGAGAEVELAPIRKKNFVSAFLDSTIPQDLRDNTVGIIKGDYVVEKKTLLHHAATSDSYDLFSRPRRQPGSSLASNSK